MMILNGLTPEYHQLKQIQHNMCYYDPSVPRLLHSLNLEFMKIEAEKQESKGRSGQGPSTNNRSQPSPSSLIVETGPRANLQPAAQGARQAVQQVGRPTVICHNCKEPGHLKKNCPRLQQQGVTLILALILLKHCLHRQFLL